MTRIEFQEQSMLNLMKSGRGAKGSHEVDNLHIQDLMDRKVLVGSVTCMVYRAGDIWDAIQQSNKEA